MRNLILVLAALIAVVTFIRAYDRPLPDPAFATETSVRAVAP